MTAKPNGGESEEKPHCFMKRDVLAHRLTAALSVFPADTVFCFVHCPEALFEIGKKAWTVDEALTGGAGESAAGAVFFKPSDTFMQRLATLRAIKIDDGVVGHSNSPSLGGSQATNVAQPEAGITPVSGSSEASQ